MFFSQLFSLTQSLSGAASLLIVAFTVLFVVIGSAEKSYLITSFLHFGPGNNDTNTASFMGMQVNTWLRWFGLVSISFLIGLVYNNYANVVNASFKRYLSNPEVTTIPAFSQSQATLTIFADPVLMWTFSIIQTFLGFTFQLQFLLPELLATLVSDIPTAMRYLREKSFSYASFS